MKYLNLSILGIATGVALTGGLIVLAVTNPGPVSYERYATDRLVIYLQDNICTPQLSILGSSLQQDCQKILQQNRADIQQLIAKGTTRQNFIVFSRYKTDLSIKTVFPFLPAEMLPAYQFETIGIIEQFHTYKAERQ